MKILKMSVVALSLLALLSSPALAQSKVATVDMRKVFNGYWKTKQSEILLDKDKADLRKDLKTMAEDFDKAQTDYKQLVEQANDQSLSTEERDRRKQAAADKVKELNNAKAAIDQFQRQAESRLSDKGQRYSGNIVTDIQKVVAEKAKAGGYTLVLNAAAAETVVYASLDNDLSDEVLKQLNAGAPLNLPTGSTNSMPLIMSTNGLP